jgi:magnesium chelatase family protein
MEVLRQPIEDGKVTIARANASISYPCSAMVVCAMNPCPCGFKGHPKKECTCPEGAAKRYLAKVSGPLLDRMDIHIEVPPVDFDKLSSRTPSEGSADIKKRVNAARKIQQERLRGTGVSCNAKMSPALTKEFCRPTPEAMAFLEKVFDSLDFSARAYDKILRVARTIADLEGCRDIETPHIMQAVQYRSLDRRIWQK